jgi:hypothetical protein
MSRKDYQKFADLIRSQLEANLNSPTARRAIKTVALEMEAIFAADNRAFDPGRFRDACGM